jgi:ADP-ribose pyrophosphatase
MAVKAKTAKSSDAEANSQKINRRTKKTLKEKKETAHHGASGSAKVMSSKVVYDGALFRVVQDQVIEPGGKESTRDVVRHNGSAVILAVDNSKSNKDPWIVMERQYRHAAGRFLWEVPAGKLDAGEDPLAGAQRELEEETGYRAKKWSELVEYYASPGFLGESMKVFLAEGLIPGDACPEDDELIELRLVKLSEVLKTIEKGGIMDGKTLSSVLLYARLLREKRRK